MSMDEYPSLSPGQAGGLLFEVVGDGVEGIGQLEPHHLDRADGAEGDEGSDQAILDRRDPTLTDNRQSGRDVIDNTLHVWLWFDEQTRARLESDPRFADAVYQGHDGRRVTYVMPARKYFSRRLLAYGHNGRVRQPARPPVLGGR